MNQQVGPTMLYCIRLVLYLFPCVLSLLPLTHIHTVDVLFKTKTYAENRKYHDGNHHSPQPPTPPPPHPYPILTPPHPTHDSTINLFCVRRGIYVIIGRHTLRFTYTYNVASIHCSQHRPVPLTVCLLLTTKGCVA
jgi:hypothetical protein